MSTKAMFETGPLFNKLQHTKADIVILQGGTDSGKTYATIQYLFTVATTTEAPAIDPVITIVSESVPNLKKGAYRIAKAMLNSNPILSAYLKTKPNESDRIFTFKTGWIMEFVGVTDEQNAKQGKRQYLFVNEAQGLSYPIFWQMAKRTRIRVVIDYNPSAPFWAHEKLIGTDKNSNDLNALVQLIISDHRHNPFLSAKEHERTENIQDPDLHAVYARGKTGNLTGLVYTNWKQIPDELFPWNADNKIGCLDFGYTNDPTAGAILVKQGATELIVKDKKVTRENIYVHQVVYQSDIVPNELAKIFKEKPCSFGREDFIYCEHDGNWIRQLRMLALLAVAANKGPGSIKAGISKVKEYNIFYTASSINIRDELAKYMWMIDPETGKPTNTPVDANNHLMDAIRYGIYSNFLRAR